MKDLNLTRHPDTVLSRLAELNSSIGIDMVEVASFLEKLGSTAEAQSARLTQAQSSADWIASSSERVRASVEETAEASAKGLEIVKSSEAGLLEAAQRAREVAEWVKSLTARMAEIETALSDIARNNSVITAISKQVNILAINAKIEAVRAGDHGRGFGVVADAVNELSRETSTAATEISSATSGLTSALGDIRDEARQVAGAADVVLEDASTTDQTLSAIASEVKKTAEVSEAIRTEAAESQTHIQGFLPVLSGLLDDFGQMAQGVTGLRDRTAGMIDRSEEAFQASVEAGGASKDSHFIEKAQTLATQIGTAFETALAQGRITSSALFDQRYRPIPGTDPAQVMAPYTELTESLLPPIQEPVLEFDPRVVFCAAVDRNGYLPTHNKKFAQPPSSDPVWNAANCRNRRIFDDRVGLKAGQNQRSFLVQVYLRDMGGGTFCLMKDLSSPIYVNGRHWGGLRLAFRVE